MVWFHVEKNLVNHISEFSDLINANYQSALQAV